MSTKRRLSQAESRIAALDAARALLIEAGPQAITLKAVAARIDRTHANVLHHFGSAAGLQKALAEHLASGICDAIGDAFAATREGSRSPRDVVDLIFNAFDRGGGQALVSWMLMSGNEEALAPIVEAIHELVVKFEDFERVRELTLVLAVMAMGDAQLGRMLTDALGIKRGSPRDSAELILIGALENAARAARRPGLPANDGL